MVKKEWVLRESGGVIKINEYRIHDVVDAEGIRKRINKEELKKYRNPDNFGRKLTPIAQRLGTEIVRIFFDYLTRRLLESDRFVFPGGSIYIGVIDRYNKKHLNFHTSGKTYGIVLDIGEPHPYIIRMIRPRRCELARRIKEGQKFYG